MPGINWQPPAPAHAAPQTQAEATTAAIAAIPAPTTIDEAKAQGLAVTGQPTIAPLAPQSGPISGKSGDFVTTVLKNFWESPTIKKLRTAVITAVSLAFGVVTAQIILVNGDLSQVNWNTTEKAAIAAAAFSIASGYAAFLKRNDNDPVR